MLSGVGWKSPRPSTVQSISATTERRPVGNRLPSVFGATDRLDTGGYVRSRMERPHRRLPAWVHWAAPVVLLVAFLLYLDSVETWHLAYTRQVDMEIYRHAGESILNGRSLYATGLLGHSFELLYDYPPFAAVLFVVLLPFSVEVLRVIVP